MMAYQLLRSKIWRSLTIGLVLLLGRLEPVLSTPLYPLWPRFVHFPIGNPLDRDLQTLGLSNDHYPEILRSRGFWDPQAQILCVGGFPRVKGIIRTPRIYLPPRDDVAEWFGPPVYPNIRSLCAKTAYGGTVRAWNAGGYCATSVNPPTVVFEQLPPRSVLDDGELDDLTKQILLICQQRCRCVQGTREQLIAEGRVADSIVAEESIDYEEIPSIDGTEISKPNPERAILYQSSPPPSPTGEKYIPLYFIPEVDARTLGSNLDAAERRVATTLWLPHFENAFAPECTGDFPGGKFGVPGATAQQMCAAEWFGGSPAGNFGLECTVGRRGKVWFKTAITQHPVYSHLPETWSGEFYDTMSACGEHCKCKDPPLDVMREKKSILQEGVHDVATDWIDEGVRSGKVVPGVIPWTTVIVYESQHSRNQVSRSELAGSRSTLDSVLRRKQMCKSQQVKGFDLAGSVAALASCMTSAMQPISRLGG